MRWIGVILSAALVLAGGAQADTYVKSESHTDGYYSGGQIVPPEDSSTEIWIGEKRMAWVTQGQKYIVDAKNNKLLVVNRRDNSYAETALPLDLSKLFSEQDLGTLQMFKRQGTVDAAKEKRKIEKWDCAGYHINDWMIFQGGRINERDLQAWYTTDVPFDVEQFNAMFGVLRQLGNLSDEYQKRLEEVKGFQVASEQTRYNEGTAITTTDRVVEMTQKEPPADAYAVPEGCTKKETLSLQDLQG